jgi:hypothetical protein
VTPGVKARLLGLLLLTLAAVFGVRAYWKYDAKKTTVGAVLSGVVSAAFLIGGVRYLVTGKLDTKAPPEPPPSPTPGGSP